MTDRQMSQAEKNMTENQLTLDVVREVRETLTTVDAGWLVCVAQDTPMTPHREYDQHRPKVKAWVESQGLDFVLKLLQLEDPHPELWHPRVDRGRICAEMDAMREHAQRVGRLLAPAETGQGRTVSPLEARVRMLLDDLRTTYPSPAPYSTEAIVTERLASILDD